MFARERTRHLQTVKHVVGDCFGHDFILIFQWSIFKLVCPGVIPITQFLVTREFWFSTCALNWKVKVLIIYFSFCNIPRIIRNYPTPLIFAITFDMAAKCQNLLILQQHLAVQHSAPWLINCDAHCILQMTGVPSKRSLNIWSNQYQILKYGACFLGPLMILY